MGEVASRDSSVRAVTELLGSPRLSYLVIFEAIRARPGPVSLEWSPASAGLQVKLGLRGELKPSVVFFQCCSWLLASIPRARGMVDALVHQGQLTERELECVVIPPHGPELTVAHPEPHARALAADLFGFSELNGGAEDPELTAQVLQTRFGFTRAEARVVCKLAEGLSIKGIAEALDVSFETARTHAKRAMQKTDTHRQAELVSLVLNGER
jgi:DNA-binding CsgD family transcriptional regulator